MKKQITIGKINGIDIFAIYTETGDIMVPIKPICTALGIDHDSQRQKLNEDDILSSVAVLSTAPGADGKQYEMLSLPLEYIYGWLFTINPKNVAPEAKNSVLKHRRECYHALYRHFFGGTAKQIDANRAEIKQLETINRLLVQEKELKNLIKSSREELAKIRAARLDAEPTLFD